MDLCCGKGKSELLYFILFLYDIIYGHYQSSSTKKLTTRKRKEKKKNKVLSLVSCSPWICQFVMEWSPLHLGPVWQGDVIFVALPLLTLKKPPFVQQKKTIKRGKRGKGKIYVIQLCYAKRQGILACFCTMHHRDIENSHDMFLYWQTE